MIVDVKGKGKPVRVTEREWEPGGRCWDTNAAQSHRFGTFGGAEENAVSLGALQTAFRPHADLPARPCGWHAYSSG